MLQSARDEQAAWQRALSTTLHRTGIPYEALRYELFDTSICMVGSHLSSGSNNKEERNADYHAIARDLVFTRGRTIDSHDHIFWAGDLNYRIALPSAEEVRDLASRRQL